MHKILQPILFVFLFSYGALINADQLQELELPDSGQIRRPNEVRVLELGENFTLTNYYRVASQSGTIDGDLLINCRLFGARGLNEVLIASSPPARQADGSVRMHLCVCDGQEWHSFPPGGACPERPVFH